MNQRITRLREFLAEAKLDALLISDVHNIFYITNFPSFSKEEREAFLLITKKNNYLFTDGRYSEAVTKKVPHVTLVEITGNHSFKSLYKKIVQNDTLTKIGFEEENLTYAEYSDIVTSKNSLIPLRLDELRIVKTTEEIACIQAACDLGDETLTHAKSLLKEGISEKYLAAQIELYMKQKGHDISFRPIVAFGENASMAHHESGERTLHKNEFVLFDMGAKVDNYCSDMTRCIFFGTPSDRQKKVYEAVASAQQKAIDHIATTLAQGKDLTADTVDKAARKMIEEKGFPSFSHALGHGIGMQVHETPYISSSSEDDLIEGMVFSIEPGIYISGEIGIRIEDLVTITDNNVIQLTHSPKELICVQ